MANNRNCRPHNDGKEPEKDADQGDWVRNNFDQAASGAKKNGYCCRADEKGRFSAHHVAPTFCATTRFCLFQHRSEERRVGKECRFRWGVYYILDDTLYENCHEYNV